MNPGALFISYPSLQTYINGNMPTASHRILECEGKLDASPEEQVEVLQRVLRDSKGTMPPEDEMDIRMSTIIVRKDQIEKLDLRGLQEKK